SSQIASVNGSAVTGTIPVGSVPAGSTNYIQNTTSQQASSNFNISGSGTAGGTLSANVVNATTQFNLGGNRILSAAGSSNLFAGINAGINNTGTGNAFFGTAAGQANTTASTIPSSAFRLDSRTLSASAMPFSARALADLPPPTIMPSSAHRLGK